MQGKAHHPNIDSFYHLSGEDVSGKACRGTACFVARHLNPGRWHEANSQAAPVYCLGKCYSAPASGSEDDRPNIEVRTREPVVLGNVMHGPVRTVAEYTARGGYTALEQAVGQSQEEILDALELSGLRGRGGAGFPTGRKWRAVAEQRSSGKFVVANADEGDSGAYIDRFLIEDDPHRLLEAMAIAGFAIGAAKGCVYLRKEYPQANIVLQQALADARREGFLGERILQRNFSFDVEVTLGEGSYVCGEETALLNSIEGHRPEVRSRPPYPFQEGLFSKPTLINNVETLANIPWIVRNGGEAYGRLGFSKSRGVKVVSLNSLFHRPGLYEVEFGVPVRQIVEDLGGGLRTGKIKGIIIGGPLAGIVPPKLFDTLLGFEELAAIGASVGHGGVVAFDEHTSLPELIHHVFDFGAFESCGKCTPCRLGSRRVEQLFRRILKSGSVSTAEKRECHEIISALAMTSLCGLGTGLAEFAASTLRYYAEELQECFA